MPAPQTFSATVIRPVLFEIGLYSKAAEELLLGTAIAESDLKNRTQLGGGSARSYFQMEPTTHDDIWNNFLKYRPGPAVRVSKLLSKPDADKHAELENNDRYAVAMARIHYLRVSAPLPAAGDVKAMAAYWKTYYNTPLGRGTREKYIEKWERANKR